MPGKKQGGPVEVRLRDSTREEICALCDCSNQELLAIMEQEMERPGEEFDDELFDAAQSLLDERTPIGEQVDVETACREFLEAHANLFQQEGGDKDRPTEKKRRRSVRQILRTTVITAALVIGIFCLGVVATGRDPFVVITDAGEVLIRNVTWGPSGTLNLPQPNGGYTSLEEALSDYNAEDAAVITWIPSRFSIDTITVQNIPSESADSCFKLWIYYHADEGELVYGVLPLPHMDERSFIEKDLREEVTVLSVQGKKYEIVNNKGWMQIYWVDDNYSYTLTGNISEEEAEGILLSLE